MKVDITDRTGATLEVTVNEGSAWARYARLLREIGVEGIDLARVAGLPLSAAPVKQVRIGLAVREPLELEEAVTFDAGIAGWVAVFVPGETTPGPAGFVLGPGMYGIGVGLRGTIGTNPAAIVAAPLAFGFEAGSVIEYTNVLLFEAAAAPRFADALGAAVAGFTIPVGREDLEHLDAGRIATVEGNGSIALEAELGVAILPNPLALVELPAPVGPVHVRARGSLAVAARVTVSGGYQVRVRRVDPGRVELAVATGRSGQLALGPSIAAGIQALSRRGDLLKRVVDAISEQPRADRDALSAAGVSQRQVAEIEQALARGLERRVELAASSLWSAGSEQRALLRCVVDLGALSKTAAGLLADALRGRIAALAKPVSAGAGLQVQEHGTWHLQRTGIEIRASLLGLFNKLRLAELLKDGSVVAHPVTGDWLVTDHVRAGRIAADLGSIGERSRNVRRLVAESVLATAAYRYAAGAPPGFELALEHEYVEQHERTARATLEDYLGIAAALGAVDSRAAAAPEPSPVHLGPTIFVARVRYDDDALEALFAAEGHPRRREEYESAGRRALALLVAEDGRDAVRRLPAVDGALWARMRDVGPFNFAALPPFERLAPALLAVVVSDYAAIAWWASSMALLSERVLESRAAPGSPASPASPESVRRRDALRSALARALRDTRPQFGEPWGLVAMALAAAGRAHARVAVSGPQVALAWQTPGWPGVLP